MNFTWLNPPKTWSTESMTDLKVHTDPGTDFWQKTHNGHERDNGHFYYEEFMGDVDFIASVGIRGKYQDLYDHGGLMIRIDDKNWLKCGVEYVRGQQFASVVTTINGWSDWSIVRIQSPEILKIRLKRHGQSAIVEFAENDNDDFQMMRKSYFPKVEENQKLMFGLMCCSPCTTGSGFDINFVDFNFQKEHNNK